MALSVIDRDALIDGNRQEYGDRYAALKFPSHEESERAMARRRELLDSLAGRAVTGFAGTKLDCRSLSPGCRLCGEGSWSCLFINDKCNCRCFYCPAPQEKVGEPTTNTLRFPRSQDYLDYLAAFGFRGVSISGGEPLLTPDRTLAYLTAVKKRFGDAVHLWLYTNGTLLTRDLVLRLRDAGLNEIRFDIGATRYHLKKAVLAVGVIDHVTVEIPAVPEDEALLRDKIREMGDVGIDYLNLHQLRLTPFNFAKLAARGYTFLHGEKVTVLESELTALNLLNYSLDNRVGPPINYCSFVYKHRYQRAAARRKYAPIVRRDLERVTESGFLRSLVLAGEPERLRTQAQRLRERGGEIPLWQLNPAGDRLAFAAELWDQIDFSDLKLRVRYSEAAIAPSVSYRNPFTEVKLNKNRKVVVEKRAARAEIELTGPEIAALGTLLTEPGKDPDSRCPAEIQRFERIQIGLQDYF